MATKQMRDLPIMERMRDQMQANRAANDGEIYAKDGKICPFRSTPDKEVLCSSRCMLFRVDKNGYECPLAELSSISWSLKPLRGK